MRSNSELSLPTHGPALTQEERDAINDWRWFSSLSASTRHDLLRHCTVRRYMPDEVIADYGAKTCEWLACARGAVRIGSASESGKEVVLTYVQPGVWFAGPGLFDGGPATHEAIAFGETTILSIGRENFTALLSESAELCVAVLRLQARHIRELYEALQAVNTLPLRARLARQLVSLVLRHGIPSESCPGETRIGIRLSQTQIAHLVGCSRQRLNLELKQMERAGFIRVVRDGLVICDPEALRAE